VAAPKVVPIRADMPAAITLAEVRSGVGVLKLEGRLCAEAVPACVAGMGVLLRRRPHTLVIDLARVATGPRAMDLLEAMRRHAEHHGVMVWLAAVPADLTRRLAECAQRQYRVMPTAQVALQFLQEGKGAEVGGDVRADHPIWMRTHQRRQ